MELINNVDKTLRDDMAATLRKGSKVAIAAASFSIYAFQELKEQLQDIAELRFIFTSPQIRGLDDFELICFLVIK